METQQWVPFALLSSYKIFRAAVNNIEVVTHIKCPILLSDGNNALSRNVGNYRSTLRNVSEERRFRAHMRLNEKDVSKHFSLKRRPKSNSD